ncbi:hypothetical protein HAL_38960 [Haladaptatus sp. T7]|nr:hypothetical protein HAL_38960 [Haladaptatus sp. T7]
MEAILESLTHPSRTPIEKTYPEDSDDVQCDKWNEVARVTRSRTLTASGPRNVEIVIEMLSNPTVAVAFPGPQHCSLQLDLLKDLHQEDLCAVALWTTDSVRSVLAE